MTRPRYLLLGVVYLALYVIGARILDGYPLARSLFGNANLLAPPILICAIILHRRRHWVGCHRLFWDTFGIGIGLWAIGHVGWSFDQLVYGQVTWLEWHTIFSLCGGIGPMIAFLARPHRGARAENAGTVSLVIASYGLLAVFIYSYFVLVPGLVLGTEEANLSLLTLVQVNRAILFSASAATVYFAWTTRWRAAYLQLALATALGLALRFGTNVVIMRGTYHPGTLFDLAWIGPFLLYASAALSAPDSAADVRTPDTPAPVLHASISALPVLLIPLIGYGGLVLQPLGRGPDAFLSLLTGLMTVAGLALLTVRLALQGSELQRSDARRRLLVAATEQTADLILITRADGGFEHANDAFVRALGYTRKELSALSFADLMEPAVDTLPVHIPQMVRARGTWRGTVLRLRRDGTTFPSACTVVGLKDDAGQITHFVGVERDITEELKLRDQLVHSERLSAIGELVAGVAHEINNPLQTIVGSVELMMEERNVAPSRRDLEIVRREATRAGQIVRNLLSFVRRGAPDRVTADLNEIVRTTVELRDFHLSQRNITLQIDLQAGGLSVMVNREEIQQIVLNLLLNAEHAVLGAAREGTISLRSWTSGDRQVLEVADDGPGVSPEWRGRIFEPFFTTKEVGEGTGLGLSISHGIASAHGGALELMDTARGACFRLTLPVHLAGEPASDKPLAGPSVVARPAVEATGPMMVDRAKDIAAPPDASDAPMALVVDDEQPIRSLLARLLARRGYQVSVAETGEVALAMNARDRLALVLCDVRMRGLNGFEIYRRMTAEHPGLASRFVFISGDGASVAEEEPDLRDVPVLGKPFTAVDLDALLARVGGQPFAADV